MGKTVRIGILGLIHDHVWGHIDDIRRTPGAELVAVADTHRELREMVDDARGYDTAEQLLDEEEIDVAYVFSDNAAGAQLATMAARRGLPVLLEKPMAHNLAAATVLIAAAREAGTPLMVNWPFAWWPQLQEALAIARRGELGQVWQVKYRAAHAGPAETGCSRYFCEWLFDPARNGGGALVDYGCYGALLARVLLGMPDNVNGARGRLCKDELEVEDNAVIVMSYPWAIAIAEASWTEIGKLSAYTTLIYGTEATLLVEPRAGGRLLKAMAGHSEGVPVDVPAPPVHRQTATAHMLHSLETGESPQPLCTANAARDVQEILEAAVRSADSGRAVSLPL